MRKLAAAVLGSLLLTGCAANWQSEEVRYKVISTKQVSSSEYFDLELVGDAPKGVLEPEQLKRKLVSTSQAGGVQVGDEVICAVKQKKGSAFEDSNVSTSLTSCKKA